MTGSAIKSRLVEILETQTYVGLMVSLFTFFRLDLRCSTGVFFGTEL